MRQIMNNATHTPRCGLQQLQMADMLLFNAYAHKCTQQQQQQQQQ